MSLYHERYIPGHPMWQDIVVHGTDQRDVEAILKIGLVPGGIYDSELKRRSEIHLVTSVVKKGKTPGVRKGSSAYIYVNMRQMYDKGI
jgi:RNA:NAD 2'-phosphotransferase (TPT1/KptA family)